MKSDTHPIRFLNGNKLITVKPNPRGSVVAESDQAQAAVPLEGSFLMRAKRVT